MEPLFQGIAGELIKGVVSANILSKTNKLAFRGEQATSVDSACLMKKRLMRQKSIGKCAQKRRCNNEVPLHHGTMNGYRFEAFLATDTATGGAEKETVKAFDPRGCVEQDFKYVFGSFD